MLGSLGQALASLRAAPKPVLQSWLLEPLWFGGFIIIF